MNVQVVLRIGFLISLSNNLYDKNLYAFYRNLNIISCIIYAFIILIIEITGELSYHFKLPFQAIVLNFYISSKAQ